MAVWAKTERDAGRHPSQLLLLLQEIGDIGNLAKIAYIGISVSIIEGETIHRARQMRTNSTHEISDKTQGELQNLSGPGSSYR